MKKAFDSAPSTNGSKSAATQQQLSRHSSMLQLRSHCSLLQLRGDSHRHRRLTLLDKLDDLVADVLCLLLNLAPILNKFLLNTVEAATRDGLLCLFLLGFVGLEGWGVGVCAAAAAA